MRAVTIVEPGGPEVLRINDVADPVPGPGDVVIDVHATALNRADLLQRRGFYPPPKGASEILGLECAGTVAAQGADVQDPPVGARVMALLAGGGYAEKVVVPREHLIPIPETMSFTDAAAIPEAFMTAHEALVTEGQTQPGNTVLIHAAAGGVGTAAVQLAKLLGADVVATAGSPAKLERVKQLGADVMVNYREDDFVAALRARPSRGADVILDFVGAANAERHQACLNPGGRWVVIGLLGGLRAEIDFSRILMARQRILGLVMRSRSRQDKAAIARRFQREILPHLVSGKLTPIVDRTFPLDEARSAHELMERNENVGKIVLSVR